MPLNEAGRAQAHAAARALADVQFDRVIATGLPRTNETAAIVVGERGPTGDRGRASPARDRPGRLSDIPPDALRRYLHQIDDALACARGSLYDGRDLGALQEQVLPAYHAIAADLSWRRLLLVAHGAVNRVILAEVLGTGLASIGHLEQDPACISIFDLNEAGYGVIRMVNYTPYNSTKDGIELTTMERAISSSTNHSEL